MSGRKRLFKDGIVRIALHKEGRERALTFNAQHRGQGGLEPHVECRADKEALSAVAWSFNGS